MAKAGRSHRVAAIAAIGLSLGVVFSAATAHDGSSVDRRTADLIRERFVSLDGKPALSREQTTASALIEDQPLTSSIMARIRSLLGRPGVDDGTVRFGDRTVPRAIVDTITRAAEATEIDPAYMMALADKESSFNPRAKASTSSALGLYQFLSASWLEMIRDYGAKHGFADEAASVAWVGSRLTIADPAKLKRVLALRTDPYLAGVMAGELIKRDRGRIEARIGRELRMPELYLAHFLGASSAGRFLSLKADSPSTVASNEFRGAARANRSLFNGNVDGKSRALTVAEVHEKLDGLIDSRITLFGGVSTMKAQPAPAEPVIGGATTFDARLRIPDQAIPTLH